MSAKPQTIDEYLAPLSFEKRAALETRFGVGRRGLDGVSQLHSEKSPREEP